MNANRKLTDCISQQFGLIDCAAQTGIEASVIAAADYSGCFAIFDNPNAAGNWPVVRREILRQANQHGRQTIFAFLQPQPRRH